MRPALIVSDVEGCLIPAVRARSWDLQALAEVAAYNREARRSGAYPPLTLCTGRPAQFVDAIGQAIDLFVPAVCENGAVLYDPRTGTYELLSGPSDRELLERVRRFVEQAYVEPGWVKVAQGKEICLSVVPLGDRWPEIRALEQELVRRLRDELGIDPQTLHITHSAGAVDITPPGVDKASGVRALLARLRTPPASVLAVGDSGNDLPMLAYCGFSAAPGNARQEVLRAVDYVATAAETRGILEILRIFTSFRPGSSRPAPTTGPRPSP